MHNKTQVDNPQEASEAKVDQEATVANLWCTSSLVKSNPNKDSSLQASPSTANHKPKPRLASLLGNPQVYSQGMHRACR